MSEEKKANDLNGLLPAHHDFWQNSPGTVLRSQLDYSREPYRKRLRDQNIKGELTPEALDIEKLITETKQAYQSRSWRNGDAFEFVQFAYVIPWLEAIIGCRLYALGRGASIMAKPANIAPKSLPPHLSDTLSNLSTNPWFQKLAEGYRALAKVFGTEFPIAPTNMRGPGDMVGALLGHRHFVERMLEPAENKAFLNELLELCTKIFIATNEMQCNLIKGFAGGCCNPYGIWAPRFTARSQEDVAALLSPQLYAEYLLPYEVQIANTFDYSVFHMHSASGLAIYHWQDFCRQSQISCLEVALDPLGPRVGEIIETLLAMNSARPLILDTYAPELADAVEEHICDFPGSVLHTRWDQSLV